MEGCVGEDVKELPYLLTIMGLWPGYWEEKLERTNKNVDEENVRGVTQENGRFWKLWRFSRSTFGLGGSRLWEKYPKISGRKRKRSSIISKVDLYEVFASLFQMIYYCYN